MRELSDQEILSVFSKFTIFLDTPWQKVQLARELLAASAAPAEGRETVSERAAMTQAWGEISAQMYARMVPWEFYQAGWTAALATAPTMSEAARDVLAERRRQVEVEGFTPEHDDEHDACEMADAAAAYALYYSGWAEGGRPVEVWPADWSHKWWKPTTPRRDLVKAGALILAEIERIDRAAAKGGSK